jgi:surfeit locus 1 family protein
VLETKDYTSRATPATKGLDTSRLAHLAASRPLVPVAGVNNLQFRAGVVPTLVTLALLALLFTLGVWQLGRADYKSTLFAAYSERSAGPPIDLNDPVEVADEDRYARAFARGRFDSARQFLLDNRTHKGVVGYDVLTPFRISGTQRILLVNRGWVALGQRRDILPDVSVDEDDVRLSGLLDRAPQGGIVLGAQGYEASGWPLVVQRIEIQSVEDRLDTSVLPLVLRMDAELPHGYVREWKPYFGLSAARHRGYAFQWFALATALVVIYVVVNTKRRSPPKT